MRAAFYTRQGPASEVMVVAEQPEPLPGPGEVRVRLRTSGVNPSDVKRRAGLPGRPQEFPLIIPHSDGAGEIDRLGTGVPRQRLGERVWIWNAQWRRPFGTAAEYVVIPARQAIPLPLGVDESVGACLGIPALTAMQAVHLAQAARGTTVLITGAAGAVGHYAVQMAKLRGARVIATVSSDEKAIHARRAGADEVINYRTESLGECIRELTAGKGVDSIIEVDLGGQISALPRIIRPHGIVAVYGTSCSEATLPLRWLLQNSVSLRPFLVYDLSVSDREAAISHLVALLRAKQLLHTIASSIPLQEISVAHRLVETGAQIGKVVLEIT